MVRYTESMEKRLSVHIDTNTSRPSVMNSARLKEGLAEAKKLIEASNKLIASVK